MNTSSASSGPSSPLEHAFHLYHLKGLLSFLTIFINLIFWIVPLIMLALFKFVLPFPVVRKRIYRWMAWIYYLAAWLDGFLLFRLMGIQLDVTGIQDTYPGNYYLIISNHQTWSDILILQHLFNFKAPLVKFLAKRELIFMPIIGWICWAYDFPFLHRKSFKKAYDQNQTKRSDTQLLTMAVDKFKQSSASIVNFVEGTRFSNAKSKRQHSPYKHLLKPKAGGLHTLLQALGNQLDAIIDITIVYDLPDPDFWDFLCGRCKQIRIKANTIKLNKAFGAEVHKGGPIDFETLTEWITKIWQLKDIELELAYGR